jgi:hypothetical protein
MEHIHSDLSAEKCLEFFHAERDEDVTSFLANALLAQVPQAPLEMVFLGVCSGRGPGFLVGEGG